MALIDKWSQVGRDFKDLGKGQVKDVGKNAGTIAKDFGKTFVSTMKYAAGKVSDWADEDDKPKEQPPQSEE